MSTENSNDSDDKPLRPDEERAWRQLTSSYFLDDRVPSLFSLFDQTFSERVMTVSEHDNYMIETMLSSHGIRLSDFSMRSIIKVYFESSYNNVADYLTFQLGPHNNEHFIQDKRSVRATILETSFTPLSQLNAIVICAPMLGTVSLPVHIYGGQIRQSCSLLMYSIETVTSSDVRNSDPTRQVQKNYYQNGLSSTDFELIKTAQYKIITPAVLYVEEFRSELNLFESVKMLSPVFLEP